MKRHEVKDLLPIVQEFAAGTPIQKRTKGFPNLSWEDCGDDCKFSSADEHRIKPTPKPPQYRAWTATEVKMGALIRHKTHAAGIAVIIYSDYDNQILFGRTCEVSQKEALEFYEHSIDGGLTFKPCGVLIEE